MEQIGRLWQEKSERLREYRIVPESCPHDQELRADYLPDREYNDAQRLKRELLRQYRGNNIQDVTGGRVARNERGSCLAIQEECDIDPLSRPGPAEVLGELLSDLKLVLGIREETEKLLKSSGYPTLESLAGHPRFGEEARTVLEILLRGDPAELFRLITFRYSRSHPQMLRLSGLHEIEQLLFLDIETMGLFQRPIILIGVAGVSGGRIMVSQYLARDIPEEPAAICAALSHLEQHTALVTYNGRCFDVPYIGERAVYYRMAADLNRPNFDLLFFARRSYRELLPDCRLCTLEQHLLGIERDHDVLSALVPEFYETYLRTGNPGPLVPILEHNKQDLISLARMFFKLSAEWRPCR
ncbi:MAG: ribonuclease H-like domain-containing protein [Thermacetogeniaceae bacterium]